MFSLQICIQHWRHVPPLRQCFPESSNYSTLACYHFHHNGRHYYVCQARLCDSRRLFVSEITQKVIDGFKWNPLKEILIIDQETNDYIFVKFLTFYLPKPREFDLNATYYVMHSCITAAFISSPLQVCNNMLGNDLPDKWVLFLTASFLHVNECTLISSYVEAQNMQRFIVYPPLPFDTESVHIQNW